LLVEPEDAGAMDVRHSPSPVLISEVLSPSSVDTDMIEKPVEYGTIPSLEAYVVVSQDMALCWVWERKGETAAFPEKPLRIEGRDYAIALKARGIALPLSEIYRNIPTVDD